MKLKTKSNIMIVLALIFLILISWGYYKMAHGNEINNVIVKHEVCTIDNIIYDNQEKGYCISLTSKNGNGWYYSILKSDAKNQTIENMLNVTFKGHKVDVQFNDNGTDNNIYDDIIEEITLINE